MIEACIIGCYVKVMVAFVHNKREIRDVLRKYVDHISQGALSVIALDNEIIDWTLRAKKAYDGHTVIKGMWVTFKERMES